MSHNICMICNQNSNNLLICSRCYISFLENSSWHGCARCGHNTCISCENITEYATVQSLFRLNNGIARLLLEAKDKSNQMAINLLQTLTRASFKKAIVNIKKQNNSVAVILSPLRKNRIMNSFWHPVQFLKKILDAEQIYSVSTVIEGVQRQTFLPFELRKTSQKKVINISPGFLLKSLEPYDNLIFVDDVLTSGGSALRLLNLCKKHSFLQNKKWHILTLFRTPVASIRIASNSN